LEKRELLSSNWSYEDLTKPKKYYSLTREGERALDMMVRAWSKLTNEVGEIIEEADSHE
jgi:DNA-binding PadR family transcriptional regulator